jgi:dTDP-4-dehydrorhamnose reductase
MAGNGTHIAVLGGRGMLGTDVVQLCRRQGHDVRVYDLPEFDITDSQQLKEVINSSGVIINCAAYTNVDSAESEAELANKINAEAVGNLGKIARAYDKWVLHVSTDFIFDGRLERPYIETDIPNPISQYGRTKLAGERFLTQSGCRHCIMRVEWTYGLAGNNFVTKIVSRAKENKPLKIVDDQIGSPTATTQAARAISELLSQETEGLFHFASAGYVSRYDMAKFIFNKLSMEVDVVRCKTSDYNSPAARPLNSRFDCSKIQALLNMQIEPWQVPLERFLRKL